MIDPPAAAAAWAALEQPWQLAFELAWEAFQAGSVPVGAVVVDPGGDLVTQGRSRSTEPTGPSRQLAGTSLAHAEVNALAVVPGEVVEELHGAPSVQGAVGPVVVVVVQPAR